MAAERPQKTKHNILTGVGAGTDKRSEKWTGEEPVKNPQQRAEDNSCFSKTVSQ